MTGVLLVLLSASISLSHASDSCGVQKTNVIQDSEEGLVEEMEFPWIVSLQDSHHTHLAFGSILSEFWVLSIASTFQHRKNAYAVVGIARMDPQVISHEEYPVNTIIIHEDFDNETMTNNLALLKTDTPMQLDSLVQPICFLTRKLPMSLVMQNCWVAGWNPTLATGNHMTMSILRKISVHDIDDCPFHRFEKTGCGNHIAEETDEVCLGDPGNPLMCQLQKSDLWVLKGILSSGGEQCPGLFLYVKVDDYSNWIVSKTKTASLPLSAIYHWKNSVPAYSYSPQTTETQKKNSGLRQLTWSQTQSQGQASPAAILEVRSSESEDFKTKGIRELGSSAESGAEPEYYHYYSEPSGQMGSLSGQQRFHGPQELILFSFVFSFVMVESRS